MSAPRRASSAPSPRRWRWPLFGAALVLALSITLPTAYLRYRPESAPAVQAKPAFIGSSACRDCHATAYEKWMGSNHQRSMAAATEQTVLGDFGDASFEYFGTVSRFYRKDGGFWVHAEGPDGRMTDFEVSFVFGVHPLQQYLVKFPGGRLQCLSIAWDDVKKQWYHLYPNERIAAGDWLHWTRGAQNWNGMCSECHSTNLHEGYAPDTDTYATTYSEITVGCEACHGPGSQHLEWARQPPAARPAGADPRARSLH